MPELQKMIDLYKRLIKNLAFYKKENKRLESLIFQLKEENLKLKEENLNLSTHQQFPR